MPRVTAAAHPPAPVTGREGGDPESLISTPAQLEAITAPARPGDRPDGGGPVTATTPRVTAAAHPFAPMTGRTEMPRCR
jgi:hypothetical protein